MLRERVAFVRQSSEGRLLVSRCGLGPHGALGGGAALDVLTGDKWHQGVGLAGLGAMGTGGLVAQVGLVAAVTIDGAAGSLLALPPGPVEVRDGRKRIELV